MLKIAKGRKDFEEEGSESVDQELQKQLNKGKCGWLEAERNIGNIGGVKVYIRLESVFASYLSYYRKWGISAGTTGCQQTEQLNSLEEHNPRSRSPQNVPTFS